MSTVISLRPDAEVDAALAELGDTYGNRTNTFKAAIMRLAAEKRRQVRLAEIRAVANDPADRAEMLAVLEEMEQLSAS